MVPDEKSDVVQVGAAPAESPTLLPQCGIAALGVGLPCVTVLANIWRQLPGNSGKRARWRCGPFAARLFLRTPIRRHAHAASDRGTNRIA